MPDSRDKATGGSDARLILASASPRRRELLRQIGISARPVAVDIDESSRPDEHVVDFVQRLAAEKALRGFEIIDNPLNLPVLGSDTAIEFRQHILGKPRDREHARQILQQLSAQKHTVHTAVAIVDEGEPVIALSSSQVWFKPLTDEEIRAYLATGEADDKAGAYAIQGIAAQFVRRIEGSYSGIMGLPLYETAALLQQCGIEPLPGSLK